MKRKFYSGGGGLRPVVESFSVSMPSLVAKVAGGREGNIKRPMYLDTGASFSCISQAAYDKDFRWLKASGGTVVALEPLQLNMFTSQQSVVTHMMQGVTLHNGVTAQTCS